MPNSHAMKRACSAPEAVSVLRVEQAACCAPGCRACSSPHGVAQGGPARGSRSGEPARSKPRTWFRSPGASAASVQPQPRDIHRGPTCIGDRLLRGFEFHASQVSSGRATRRISQRTTAAVPQQLHSADAPIPCQQRPAGTGGSAVRVRPRLARTSPHLALAAPNVVRFDPRPSHAIPRAVDPPVDPRGQKRQTGQPLVRADPLFFTGAAGRNRTHDPLVRSFPPPRKCLISLNFHRRPVNCSVLSSSFTEGQFPQKSPRPTAASSPSEARAAASWNQSTACRCSQAPR